MSSIGYQSRQKRDMPGALVKEEEKENASPQKRVRGRPPMKGRPQRPGELVIPSAAHCQSEIKEELVEAENVEDQSAQQENDLPGEERLELPVKRGRGRPPKRGRNSETTVQAQPTKQSSISASPARKKKLPDFLEDADDDISEQCMMCALDDDIVREDDPELHQKYPVAADQCTMVRMRKHFVAMHLQQVSGHLLNATEYHQRMPRHHWIKAHTTDDVDEEEGAEVDNVDLDNGFVHEEIIEATDLPKTVKSVEQQNEKRQGTEEAEDGDRSPTRKREYEDKYASSNVWEIRLSPFESFPTPPSTKQDEEATETSESEYQESEDDDDEDYLEEEEIPAAKGKGTRGKAQPALKLRFKPLASKKMEAVGEEEEPEKVDEAEESEGREKGSMNVSSRGISDEDKKCLLCGEECRYPGRHIAQRHLSGPLYSCPVCGGYGSYENCSVLKHMQIVHGKKNLKPNNNMDLYKDELIELQQKCFPNRPMKLIPKEKARPRGRHNCAMCLKDVAQSDRQRHVYHKHLKKRGLFECPQCTFISNYDVHRVKEHIRWCHKDSTAEPVSHEEQYRKQIDALNEKCFPGWQHRKKPFWWLESDDAKTPAKQPKQQPKGEEPKQSEKEDDEIIEEEGWVSPPVPASPSETSKSQFNCRMCLKHFKPSANFLRHAVKHHMNIALYICPICEGQGNVDSFEVKLHMQKIHGVTDRKPISTLKKHATDIQKVYSQCFPGRQFRALQALKKQDESTNSTSSTRVALPRTARKKADDEEEEYEPEEDSEEEAVEEETWRTPQSAKRERVKCHACKSTLNPEDRQIHVYRHHLKDPRLYECPICEFAHHASSAEVTSHIKYAHPGDKDAGPRSNVAKNCKKIIEWNEKCFPGWINRRLPALVNEDFSRCRICDEEITQLSRHIAEVHLKIFLHECPLCDYGALERRLVVRHLKNKHNRGETEPISNVVKRHDEFSAMHDKCFPGRPKRLSIITISEEGRRAKCRMCEGVFSRRKRIAHLIDEHNKKTTYKCSECDFSSARHDEEMVTKHIKEEHGGKGEAISCIDALTGHLKKLNGKCFPDYEFDLNDLRKGSEE